MRVISLRKKSDMNMIVESTTKRLLGMYVDSKGEKLTLSPSVKKPDENYRADQYGLALLSLGQEKIFVPPPHHIVSKIIAYIRNISEMHSAREGIVYAESDRIYTIPFLTSIDKQTNQEEIIFFKPTADLERRVG